jgi:LytS/YehU family sensor histidine kinase
MENIRGRKIRFLHDPRPTDNSIFIPPLSLVTLIENAVKHGQADENSVLSVELICQIEGKLITLIVRNRGEIRDQGKGTQPGGLSLLRQQLSMTHGSTSSIELVKSAPHFVEARITFSDPR